MTSIDVEETGRYPSFFDGAVAQHFGRDRSAMRHYRNEIEKTGYWKAHFNLAWLLAQRGRRGEAARHYRQAVRNHPPRADKKDAYENLGLLYHRLGREREAMAALMQAHALDRNDPSVLLHMAMVLFENGREARAARWLRKWERGERRGDGRDGLAAYLLIEYDVDVRTGVALLRRRLSADRHDPVGRADLAVAYAKLGDKRRASAFARQANRLVRTGASNQKTRRVVARALRKVGLA